MLAVLVDDAEHRLGVLRVAGEGAHGRGDARGLRVGLAVHERRHRRRVGAPALGVVGQAAVHEQHAQVRVAEAERPVVVAVLVDGQRRVARVVDQDLLRGDHGAAGGAEGLGVELAVRLHELHEVQGGQVAGGVVEEHVLRARVAGVDARRVRAGVPVVDGGVELHARVAALPGRLRHHLHEVARAVGVAGPVRPSRTSSATRGPRAPRA